MPKARPRTTTRNASAGAGAKKSAPAAAEGGFLRRWGQLLGTGVAALLVLGSAVAIGSRAFERPRPGADLPVQVMASADLSDQASTRPMMAEQTVPMEQQEEAVSGSVLPTLPPSPPAAPPRTTGGGTGAGSALPQVALMRPQPLPPLQGRQRWQAYALPAPALHGRIPLTVIIDDMGVDHKRSARTVALPGPLTLSYLPYGRGVGEQARQARAQGHELMLHLPMEAEGRGTDPGPGALLTSLSLEEIRHRTRAALTSFDGYVGVNNHMGSRMTTDAARMGVVLDEVRAAGLIWLDSRTTPRSVGYSMARQKGMPSLARDVFLDDDPSGPAVRRQLAALEAVARRQGHGIAIGHPKDDTIAALADWLPTLAARGFVLVPASTQLAVQSESVVQRN